LFNFKKNRFPNKKLNDFIINSKNVNETGKIIIENNNFLLYKKENLIFSQIVKMMILINKTNLQYKIISPTRYSKSILKQIDLFH
jgi:tRNA isopentenyl-2-thiomethyl-A-37 hydroxylase MiaE